MTWTFFCVVRGIAGPVPNVVPFVDLPGGVPAKGSGFSSPAPAGPMCCMCPRVLLGLQGQLAPRAGLPGEQPAHYVLPTRRKQVLLSTCIHSLAFTLLTFHGP